MSDAKDRSGPPPTYVLCRECGKRWHSPSKVGAPIACNLCESEGDEHRFRAFERGGFYGPDWTPPIPAPEPAKLQHPERRAGQTWRAQYKEFGNEYILVKHEPRRRGWEAKQPNGSYAFVHDCLWEADFTMTLIADAPAPEATATADAPHTAESDITAHWTKVPMGNIGQCDYAIVGARGTRYCIGDRGHEGLHAGHIQKPAPLPAGKVEAAKAVPELLACIKANCSTPDAVARKRHADKSGRWVAACDQCWTKYEADITEIARCSADAWFEHTSVLRADTPQLIDRRRSYQPMDDSFAEDC